MEGLFLLLSCGACVPALLRLYGGVVDGGGGDDDGAHEPHPIFASLVFISSLVSQSQIITRRSRPDLCVVVFIIGPPAQAFCPKKEAHPKNDNPH